MKTQKEITVTPGKIKLRLVDPDQEMPEIIDESPRKLFDIKNAKPVAKERGGVRMSNMPPIAFTYCNDYISIRIKKKLNAQHVSRVFISAIYR